MTVPACQGSSAETLTNSESCKPTCRILRKDGSYVWIESTINLLRDAATGEAIEVVAISRDITAWKRAQEKTDVIDAAPHPMIMVAADGLIALANTQTGKLFGYDRGELLGQPVEMLMPQRFRAGHINYRNAFHLSPGARAMGAGRELIGLHRNGAEIPLQISLDPIVTPDGQFMMLSIIDITERKKSEAHLQLFRAMVEGTRDYGIFALDPEGFVLSWNEGAARMKGYSESEIVGQHFSRFYTPEDSASGRPAHALQMALEHGKFEDEGVRVRRDGSRFWASVLITVLRDQDGRLSGFSKLTRDITERKSSMRNTCVKARAPSSCWPIRCRNSCGPRIRTASWITSTTAGTQ